MTDSAARYFGHFDLDVTLRDAALDEQNRPTRRMIANAAIGMHVEDAFYSVRELREAVSLVHENAAGGRAKLAGHSARPAQHCRWGGSVAPQGNRDEIKFVLSKIRLAHRRNP